MWIKTVVVLITTLTLISFVAAQQDHTFEDKAEIQDILSTAFPFPDILNKDKAEIQDLSIFMPDNVPPDIVAETLTLNMPSKEATVEISNNSPSYIIGDIAVAFFKSQDNIFDGSDTLLKITSIKNLKPNESKSLTTNVDINDGEWLIVIADYGDMIEEGDEANNILTKMVIDLSLYASFTSDPEIIDPEESVVLTLKLDNTTPAAIQITNVIVTTPTNTICEYSGQLPLTLQPGNSIDFTYPDQFNSCDTSSPGNYKVEIATEIGDPIITHFEVTFLVLSESTIGIIALVGMALVTFVFYRKSLMKKIISK